MKIDRAHVFRFASLQGTTAASVRQSNDTFPDGLETFVFWDDGEVRLRSAAVFAAARQLGLPWSLFSVCSILPRALTDAVYRWVARNRIRWFGRKDSCRMPSPDEAQLFLE
jgi:predicted DCC family thiol-disulfide oxidoreductase YuxK